MGIDAPHDEGVAAASGWEQVDAASDQCGHGGCPSGRGEPQRAPGRPTQARVRQHLAHKRASQCGHADCGRTRTSNPAMEIWSGVPQTNCYSDIGHGLYGRSFQGT